MIRKHLIHSIHYIMDIAGKTIADRSRIPFCFPFLGLLSGVKPHLEMLAFLIPQAYSVNTMVRYDTVFF